MKKQKRTIHFEGVRLRENEDGTTGRAVEGYAIVFNRPSVAMDIYSDGRTVREVISPEAVTKELLDRSDIKMTMYHNREIILARSNKGVGTLSYEIDDKGVKFYFEAPATQYGDEVLEQIKLGNLSGCSFAFWCDYSTDVTVEDDEEGKLCIIRHIDEIFDFTVAADPAYPDTSVNLRELTGGQQHLKHINDNINNSNPQEMKKKESKSNLTAYVRERLKTGNREFALRLLQREAGQAQAGGDTTVVTDDAEKGGIVPLHVQDILDQVNEGLIYDKVGMPLSFNNVGELLWPAWTAGEAKIIGETEAIAPEELNLDKLNMRPERMAIRFDVSRKALDQSDGVIEDVVMRALTNAVKRAINRVAFSTVQAAGSATLAGPLIKAALSAKKISATPTLKELTAIKGALFGSGIDDLKPVWVMNHALKAELEGTPKDAGSGIMLVENDKLLGYPVYATSVIGDNTLAFTDYTYQPAGFFGSMDLIVDPYSAAHEGKVRFILNLEYGTATLREEAFVVGKKA